MTADVRLQGLGHRYGAVTALAEIDLTIPAGQFAVLLGPSGCGKTTLLSIIGGFVMPSAGRVLIGGQDVTALAPARRPTTTVFQDYALFPHMSLRDNVAFGLRMRGVPRTDRRRRADAMLALVGLAEQGDRRPHQLSGGQRQRVALARALAVEPAVLLLDEPLGALDLKLRRQMQAELKAIQRRVGTTFIHVTHDQEEAMAIADTILVMERGAVQHHGPPETVYLRPQNRFTATFMGEANLLPATVSTVADGGLGLETALGPLHLSLQAVVGAMPVAGADVELVIRPEHLLADAPGDPGLVPLGRAVLRSLAFVGTHHRAVAEAVERPRAAAPLILHLPQATRRAAGDQVSLALRVGDVIVLPAAPASRDPP